MSFSNRLSTGWTIALNSFKVLRANKQLIIFPVLSGISLLLVMGSFIIALMASLGWDIEYFQDQSQTTTYGILFLYYLINYFIIIFFNVALTHCSRLYFHGEEVTVKKGLQFSMSRIWAIFSWAVFAATVGTILKGIQENVGILGKILTGIIGIVWGIATFFVVPVVAYENLGPLAAFRRSSQLMKQKWGESLGATFSFGLLQLIAILLLSVPLFLIGSLFHVVAGVALVLVAVFGVIIVFSAAETIFVSAVYHDVTGDPVKQFNTEFAKNLFVHK